MYLGTVMRIKDGEAFVAVPNYPLGTQVLRVKEMYGVRVDDCVEIIAHNHSINPGEIVKLYREVEK